MCKKSTQIHWKSVDEEAILEKEEEEKPVADHTYRGGITDKQMCEAVKRANWSLMEALLELMDGNMEPMHKLQDKLQDIC